MAEAVERLKQIEKGDWQGCRTATKALAEIGHPQVVELLIAALNDGKWHVRYNIAHALGEIGDLRAVEPLGIAYKEWGWLHRSVAAFSLWQLGNPDRVGMSARNEGNITLPLQILSATALTDVQKLNSLHVLIGVVVHIGGIDRDPVWVRYGIDNVQTFCQNLCLQDDTEESVKQGAEAVLAELKNRTSANTLLRSASCEPKKERQELLRGVSGQKDTTPPEELLRPLATSAEKASSGKRGILSRIFRRR